MLNDDENSTVDVSAKKVASEFKNFLKNNNKTYSENLKNLLITGFREYYEDLNKKAAEELQKQEIQQKNVHNRVDNYDDKLSSLTKRREKNDNVIDKLLTQYRNMRQKSIVFLRLFNYHNRKQLNRKVKRIVNKIHQNNLLRKSLKGWKVFSFHESNIHFENKIRERTELELKNYETTLVQQQEKILELIAKAEEKLKLEHKKKIQTKLQLDQVVLRGVSALNIQALKLSQTALNDVYKSEYLKEIEKNIKTMVFPETKEKLTSYTKRSENIQSSTKAKISNKQTIINNRKNSKKNDKKMV